MSVLYIAASIIIILGLKFLSPVLIYLILSLFLTVLIYPIIEFFEKRGFHILIVYSIVAVMVVLIFGGMFLVMTSSLKEFLNNAAFYQEKLGRMFSDVNNYLNTYGIKFDIASINIIPIIKSFLAKAGGIVSGFLVVFIGVSFMIFETKNFGKKLVYISKNKETFKLFFKNTQKYFIIKTFTSALTGVLIALILIVFKVPYAFLFGIMAFVFNFIPVIGSIIAAIPAVLIALITYDIKIALYVTIGYLIVNNLVSNVIEPKIMGDGLDLSPAVVFFSLLFWGWVFGIVGMFLAAPLTMTLKLALLSSEKTKWLGILLSNKIRRIDG
ncbi:AI-2E family transporter [Caminibacter pacificus]|uniref:AI-2E family transporter n=1 Tax=Caminibacter pacificus TaxID=1424653 RepID=A0AAJ4REQ8_9BACT|nr:AI-2E family transporter [Caminibacter pacificus]QCI28133.1 AI-2E family transporter [Caminibacter pacificus]ROR41156.1 putative PurR-regulated permease PerM [Caminibacter pacificus]